MQESRADLTVIEGGKSDTPALSEPIQLAPASKVGSRAWGSRIRSRAKELSKALDTGYMELARILYQVYDTPIEGNPDNGAFYINWGYNNFAEYSEQELGIHYKKAERLRLIWYTLEIQLKDMDPKLKERCVALGMSKVRELVSVITLRNANYWIEQAEQLSYRKLAAIITDEKRRFRLDEAILGSSLQLAESGSTEGVLDTTSPESLLPPAKVESIRQKRFDLFPTQQENVLLALRRAAEITGSDKEGHLLDLICTDFIATNDVMGSDLDKRLRYVAKIERTLGLKLVAVDPDAKEVVYGLDALKLVADEDADSGEAQ